MFLREMRSPKQDKLHIWLHELGHGFGLDDFHTPKNYNNGRLLGRAGNQTRFIMKAGAATMITEFDAWMARNMWSCLRPQMEGKGLPAFCK
jgi:hypothetical protein